MKAKHGFTLVEILIVVVILGILAAIVIPQFTDAATESKQSNLVTSLQTMRSQIELFKIQHNDKLPGACGAATFVEAMTGFTDIDGTVYATKPVGTIVYGPYMQAIPKNPFTDSDVVLFAATPAGTATGGWNFDNQGATATGKFTADDNLSTADGTPHTDL
jgi:general secretion pathway protein G